MCVLRWVVVTPPPLYIVIEVFLPSFLRCSFIVQSFVDIHLNLCP